MLAYGGVFDRKGAGSGLRRVLLSRLARLYLFQIGLLLTTLGVVFIWTRHFQMQPVIVGPNFERAGDRAGACAHLACGANLSRHFPLYIALLAVFPLIYAGLRSGPWLTLILSAAVWLIANLDGDLNLPNWMNGKTWTFDPFAWQFLFTIGAAFAMLSTNHGGALPRTRWLTWLCGTYRLCFRRFSTLGGLAFAGTASASHAHSRKNAPRRSATARYARPHLLGAELSQASDPCREFVTPAPGGLRPPFTRSIHNRLHPCTLWTTDVPHVRRRTRHASRR